MTKLIYKKQDTTIQYTHNTYMDKIKKHPFIRYYLKQEAQYPVAAQVIRHVIGSAYGSPGEEGCWKININETATNGIESCGGGQSHNSGQSHNGGQSHTYIQMIDDIVGKVAYSLLLANPSARISITKDYISAKWDFEEIDKDLQQYIVAKNWY